MSVPRDQIFGNAAQVAILTRARALYEILKGDGRFSCHGRVVGLVSPATGDMHLLASLTRLQGTSHYMLVKAHDIERVLTEIAAEGLDATHYARWVIAADRVTQAADLASRVHLPDGLRMEVMTPETAEETVASFAAMSLECGVLPAWRSAHQGQSLRSRTLLAVTEAGQVVASAYATGYMSDGSDKARRECFWGLLATHPDWRGRGLSLALGGTLLRQMRDDFGFSRFYTGITPGNLASEAVCSKLGLATDGDSIVTTADAAQLPGGRLTK